MMLIHNAYYEAAHFLTRSIRTDPEHLALGAIHEAGPAGYFLTDALTLKYMRGGEFFTNDLFDNSGDSTNTQSMLERAHEQVESLTEGFESPVPHEVQEDLRRYFHDAVYPETTT